MFVKIVWKDQVYLIRSHRLNYEGLLKLAETKFTELPRNYTFTYKDSEGDDIFIQNKEGLAIFIKNMSQLDKIQIAQSLNLRSGFSLAQANKQKIKKQNIKNRLNDQLDQLVKTQQNLKEVGSLGLTKQFNRSSTSIFKPQIIVSPIKIMQIPSFNQKKQEINFEKLNQIASILSISKQKAVNIIRKYQPDLNAQDIINAELQNQ